MADVFFINVLKHLSYILPDFLMNGIRINYSVIPCAIDLTVPPEYSFFLHQLYFVWCYAKIVHKIRSTVITYVKTLFLNITVNNLRLPYSCHLRFWFTEKKIHSKFCMKHASKIPPRITEISTKINSRQFLWRVYLLNISSYFSRIFYIILAHEFC